MCGSGVVDCGNKDSFKPNHKHRNTPAVCSAAAAQPQHQVQCRLLLDVVVSQRAAVLELLAREDEALLVRRDALLVLDLGLDVLDRVGALDLERDGLSGQRLDEDLHAAVLW